VNELRPWASGPAEILKYAAELYDRGTDPARRIAYILTDNAVELAMKVYLGLPTRVTGLQLSRSDVEALQSYPRLLDAVEKHAASKLTGIDLGTLEWYHHLRNQLYHEGNGLTVESQKVVLYLTLAKLLYHNLFGIPYDEGYTNLESTERLNPEQALSRLVQAWARLERMAAAAYPELARGAVRPIISVMEALRALTVHAVITESELAFLNKSRQSRNEAVHQRSHQATVVDAAEVIMLENLVTQICTRLKTTRPDVELDCDGLAL